jgi:hypothetical protein
MATTITPLAVLSNPDVTNRQVIADGTIAFTGAYTTGGDSINLLQLGDSLKTSNLPLKVEIWEATPSGSTPTFDQFVYLPGTTLANGLIAIANGGAQIAAGAYTGLLTATVRIRVYAPSY